MPFTHDAAEITVNSFVVGVASKMLSPRVVGCGGVGFLAKKCVEVYSA